MHTYQAFVRAQVQGRSQVIKTEVRALNAQDARWLLWAQWGFHSIQSGPTQVNNSNEDYFQRRSNLRFCAAQSRK